MSLIIVSSLFVSVWNFCSLHVRIPGSFFSIFYLLLHDFYLVVFLLWALRYFLYLIFQVSDSGLNNVILSFNSSTVFFFLSSKFLFLSFRLFVMGLAHFIACYHFLNSSVNWSLPAAVLFSDHVVWLFNLILLWLFPLRLLSFGVYSSGFRCGWEVSLKMGRGTESLALDTSDSWEAVSPLPTHPKEAFLAPWSLNSPRLQVSN